MTEDKGILIRNIYEMLTYAYQELRHNNYDYIKKEEFEQVQDLFAEILYRGVSKQLKQGLYREYILISESSTSFRGKLDVNGTIKNQIRHTKEVCCSHDELSENNIFNKILKTTISQLLSHSLVAKQRKAQLRSLLPFLCDIGTVDPRAIRWDNLKFQRNNGSYKMLMNICYFIMQDLLLTTESGTYKMHTFIEEQMPKLFEHFVLEYYRRHYPELKANADRIPWDLKDTENSVIDFLPAMQSDIVLHGENGHCLIIDTKYYTKALITHQNKTTLHSANLYQIFSYVKNMDKDHSGNISGMLLYAKTSEDITADMDANIGNNRFLVRTLDLNVEFDKIKEQLDALVQATCTSHSRGGRGER